MKHVLVCRATLSPDLPIYAEYRWVWQAPEHAAPGGSGGHWNVGAGRHTPFVRLELVLRRQAGMVSRAQALAIGMSRHQVDRLIAAGRWLPIYPGVYLAADHGPTEEGRIWSAALWVGDDATVSGLAAAWWHRLWLEPLSVVDITAPRSSGKRRGRGIRVRRRALPAVDQVLVHGLPVTGVPLTVLEAAVQLGERGSELVDRALQRWVGFDALRQAHSRNLGGHGSAAAAADRAASAAERKAIALLRAAGITGWRLHHRVGGYELDLAFPDEQVAVEVDGWAWHRDAESFRRDRQRQNALVLAGWTVLRFTWHDLTQRPDEVIAEIRAALHDRRTGLINRAQRGYSAPSGDL